jgi:uncharacterized protein YjbI with pentapeptide repeats
MPDHNKTLRRQLHQLLNARLDEEELRTLCFYVDVEYDDLRSEGKANKARELIKYLENRDQIFELVETGRQLRSDISWPDIPKVIEETTPVIRPHETDSQQVSALQTYLDLMSKLLSEGLLTSNKGDEIRAVARAQTLVVLRVLDGKSKGELVRFLHESKLITRTEPVLSLAQANLCKADLHRAFLLNDNLEGVNLQEANLRQARLSWTDLRLSTLTEANLCGAILRGVDLTAAKLTGAKLIQASLRGAILDESDLRGADLTDADLSHVRLRRAKLQKTILFGAELNIATLFSANLSDADLRQAELVNASLIGARLDRADLTGVNLTGANLHRANLTDVNLHGANLTDANVTNEQLSKTKFSSITLPSGTQYFGLPSDLNKQPSISSTTKGKAKNGKRE